MKTETTTDLSTIIEPRRNLSFSQLSTYQQCGLKYDLSYNQRAPREPSGAFLGGGSIHKTIERSEAEGWWLEAENFLASDSVGLAAWHRIFDVAVMEAGPTLGEITGWDERREALDRLEGKERAAAIDAGLAFVRWAGRGQGEDYPWWHKQGEFMLRRYQATRLAMLENEWSPIEGGVEMRVVANLEGVPIPVVGYLDKFLMREFVDRETGEVGDSIIVDYKSGKVGNAEPLQFATYSTLLRIARGLDVRRGVAIYLRAPDAEKRVQAVEFEGLLPNVEPLFAGLARGIEAGLYLPNPNAFCPGCSVRASCWYWSGTARGIAERT